MGRVGKEETSVSVLVEGLLKTDPRVDVFKSTPLVGSADDDLDKTTSRHARRATHRNAFRRDPNSGEKHMQASMQPPWRVKEVVLESLSAVC